jgi:hypothetical protein
MMIIRVLQLHEEHQEETVMLTVFISVQYVILKVSGYLLLLCCPRHVRTHGTFLFLVEDLSTPRGGVRLPRIENKKQQKYRPYGKYEEPPPGTS